MQQHLKFYLTTVYDRDEKTGDYIAFYAQFPDAISQGSTKEEAEKLLDEIFPYLMIDKGEEFIKYHQSNTMSVQNREMVSNHDNC